MLNSERPLHDQADVSTDARPEAPLNTPVGSDDPDARRDERMQSETKQDSTLNQNANSNLKAVAAAVLVRWDRQQEALQILLCQRHRGARYALKWEFPGGKVEAGESAEQAVKRELFEELRLENCVVHLLKEERSMYDDGGHFAVSFFLCPQWSGTIENRVFEDLCWIGLDQLESFDILEGNRSFCGELAELLESRASSLEQLRCQAS